MTPPSTEQMPLKRKPRAVIFDTDNTLYPYDPAHKAAITATIEKATEILGISADRFQQTFDEARRSIKKTLGETASSHSRLLYFQRAIEMLGLRTQVLATLDLEQTYWRTFLTNSWLFPEVKEFLFDLKSNGILTAIITDMTAQIQFRKLIYFGLEDMFDYVVTSEESGRDKPHAHPFEMALQKLNVAPELIWMIGDSSLADMAGAHALRMLKLQKTHAGVSVDKSGPGMPDMSFEHFSTLRKLFRKLPDNGIV